MARRLLLVMGAAVAACAPRGGGTAAGPAPAAAPPQTVSSGAPAVSPALPVPTRLEGIRYGPSALRYLVHRRLRLQQALGDQVQAQDLGARIFVAATITGPADSAGYPATFIVDSIVPDSGTPQFVVDNVSRARRLIFSGRLGARGEFVNAVASDSALAQSLVQLLANFRDFLPRVPPQGLTLGAAWTDTVETTQKGAGSEVSRRSVIQSSVPAWEDRGDARSLRLEANASYRVAGGGQNAGQPFELSGAGSYTALSFVAADGRYLGGESHDSATFTYRLPVQGIAVPVIQVTRTTVAVLP